MLTMEQSSSSSKVTVEFFDPYNVYQLLSPGLLPRLPLRNLHWESHAGPLRSINELHIDLTASPDNCPVSSQSTVRPGADLARVKSTDSNSSRDDGFRTQALGKSSVERGDSSRPTSQAGLPFKGRERRHQIPGLRQTPYLKILLLRCDDNETYKSQGRKQVREWIKENTPSSSKTKLSPQENHDAFEWCIIHVIVPNTAAATQPRISAKGGNTILEKLRADFNSTGNTPVDRVAQVRIGINDVPYDILPRVVPAIPGSYTETPKDNEEAWTDLIGKLKSLILKSFDERVSQYEEDIRERDGQRTLPGWNFCTFFMLKEGLAMGFESVGLVEDALVGYDELAVGLDAITRDQTMQGQGPAPGGSFLPYTADLKIQVDKARAAAIRDGGMAADDTEEPIDMQTSKEDSSSELDEIPLSSGKKPYRELILANNISIFDFRCYLFSRQVSLLLRLANASSSREELLAKLKELRESSLFGIAARKPPPPPSDDPLSLLILSQICKRALEFVASISRIMRQDLLAAEAAPPGKRGEDTKNGDETEEIVYDSLHLQIIDNIVSSFTFSVAQQILAQTSTSALPIPPSTLAPPMNTGQEDKASIPEPKTMMHPARSSSLIVTSPRDSNNQGNFPAGRIESSTGSSAAGIKSSFWKPGLEDLAGQRAELYLISRTALEKLGAQREWPVGWLSVDPTRQDDEESHMEDVDINAKATLPEAKSTVNSPATQHGITSTLLAAGLQTKSNFHRLYETLTDKALRYFTVASYSQSAQACVTDLALLKFYLTDYGAAASYFYRMAPFYGESGWDDIELSMLILYTRCLKELNRREEYVRVAIKMLGKEAALEKNRLLSHSAFKFGIGHESSSQAQDLSTEGHLTDLLNVISSLSGDISVPLETFFMSVEVDGTVRYHDEQDTLALQLKLRFLLADELKVEKVKVKLVPVIAGQGRDIWLETEDSIVIRPGVSRVRVQSNVNIPGTYVVGQVSMLTSKLTLFHEAETAPPPLARRQDPTFLKCPRLLIYQRHETFDMRLSASRIMHLDRNRDLELELSSGWNNIASGELHIRAATAGLRVQTAECHVVSGKLDVPKSSDPGVIRFGKLGAGEKAILRMPFSLESDASDIAVKLEVSYTTPSGSFFASSNPTVPVMLPLAVNVQDVFKHMKLFSKFTISTATTGPLRLLSSSLGDSDIFETSNGGELESPVIIFPRQPATLLYKIIPKSKTVVGNGRRRQTALDLVIGYICTNEEIDNVVKQSLEKALIDSSLLHCSRLVLPIILSQLRSRLSPYDLERAALISELSTSALSDLRWRHHFSGLGTSRLGDEEKDTALILEQWIQKWQATNPILTLPPIKLSKETLENSRSIIIPVGVPSVTVVHTADIKFMHQKSISDAVAVTNESIAASLHIKCTRIWDTAPVPVRRASQGGIPDSSSSEDLDFVYEVSAPADAWLIGGKRKGHFTVPYSKTAAQKPFEFPLLLVPLVDGYLPFPHLDIKPAPVVKHDNNHSAQSGAGAGAERVVTCETDYRNVGEGVRVVGNSRKTTVSLDASGPQGGAWLLESEKRDEGSFLIL